MPWNENSGGGGQGPWGSGGGGNQNNNPWGQRPNGGGGGGGQQPPDLDDLLRDLKRRFGGFGGRRGGDGEGGSGGGGGFFGLGMIAVILVGLWIIWPGSGWYVVGPEQNGVILRFGEYSRTSGPGFHFKIPSPVETVLLEEVTTTQEIVIGSGRNEGQMLTRDENIVDLDFTVQWRVDLSYAEGVRDYLFNVRDPQGTVRAVAESAMREVVGTSDLQFIITEGRGEVSQRTRALMQTTLDEYEAGIQILQVNLQTAQPPESVIEAFRDVDVAEQDAERARLDATAYRNRVIPEARGIAAQVTQSATAYRDSVIAEAQGRADRFVSIYSEYAQAPEVTRQRMFLERMEDLLGRSELIILDRDGGAVPYLPLDQLGRERGAQRTQGGQ